jgi:hypothetical protein
LSHQYHPTPQTSSTIIATAPHKTYFIVKTPFYPQAHVD